MFCCVDLGFGFCCVECFGLLGLGFGFVFEIGVGFC